MQKIMNSIKKDTLHRYYSVLVEDYKDYKKITRYEMFQEVQEVIKKKPELIIDLMLLDSFEKVMEITQSEEAFVKEDTFKILKHMNPLELFLIDEINDEGSQCSYKILPEVINALNNLENLSEIILKKEIEATIIGLLDVYGYLNIEELEEIIHGIFDERQFLINEHLVVFSHFYIKEIETSENGLLYYHPYFDLDIFEILPSMRVYYNKSFYIDFALNGAPSSITKPYRNQYNQFGDRESEIVLANKTHLHIQYQYNHRAYFDKIANGEDENKIKLEFNWPVWKWGGLNYFAYLDSLAEESISLSPNFLKNSQEVIEYIFDNMNQDIRIQEVNELEFIDEMVNVFSDKKLKKKMLRILPFQDYDDRKSFHYAIVIQDGVVIVRDEDYVTIYHKGNNYRVKAYGQLLDDVIDMSQIPRYLDGVLFPTDEGFTFLVGFNLKEPFIGNDDKFYRARNILSLEDLFPKHSN